MKGGEAIMDFGQQIDKARNLITFLIEMGAWRAKLIKTRDIIVDERVRFQCAHSGCRDYGKLMCPPNTPAVDEFRKVLGRYTFGIILQVKGEIKGEDWQKESDMYALKLHDLVYRGEKQAFALGFPFAAGLIGGSCKLCSECGEKCSNRSRARPSLEAVGIDVIGTCKNADMPVSFEKGRVIWTGLILLD
jgi:predicted metal-binding protein